MTLRQRRYCIFWWAIGSVSVLGRRSPLFGLLERRIDLSSSLAFVVRTQQSILQTSRGGSNEATLHDQDEVEDEEEEDDDVEEEEEEDEDEDEATSDEPSNKNKNSKIPKDPVFLTIQTASGSAVLDETIELETVVRTRTIQSVKESISKKLAAKPPSSTIALTLDGRLLNDDELVDDIVKEAEEDSVETDEPATSIVLIMEAIAPVDPKFLPDLERKIPDLTSEELLQAYAANEAALYQNSLYLEASPQPVKDDEEEEEADEDDAPSPPIRVNAAIRERAARIRADLDATILSTTNAKTLLADDVAPRIRQQQPAQIDIRGNRVRTPGKTTTSIRGILQYNLNVDWYRTGRAIVVLVFFGLFGGRTAVSKSILLLCAPLLILVQARSVKSVLTQILYTIGFHPPSIVLSLLPAPQQTILSIRYDQAMKEIYADQIIESGLKKPLEIIQEGDDEDDEDFADAQEFEEDDEDVEEDGEDEEEEDEEEDVDYEDDDDDDDDEGDDNDDEDYD